MTIKKVNNICIMSVSFCKESARLHQRISAVAQQKNPHRVVLNTLLQISPGVSKKTNICLRQRTNKRVHVPSEGVYADAGHLLPQTAAKSNLVQPSVCRILILLTVSFVFLVDLGNVIA